MVEKKLSKREQELYTKTSPDIEVEVFTFKTGTTEVKKSTMSFKQFVGMAKLTGYKYLSFQPGFCTITERD